MGYDFIEFPLVQIMDLPEEEFQTLKAQLEQTGICAEAVNVFFPRRIRLTGEGVNWDEVQAYARAAIDRAARLGAQIVVLGSSGSRNIPEGFPRPQAWEQLVHALQLIDPIAAASDVTVTLEPLNRRESNILNTVEEALALSRQVNATTIKVLVDYYHFSIEREGLEHVRSAGGAIRHVHFASVDGRSYPTQMMEEYQLFFACLHEIGYSGRVSIEAGTQDLLADAPRALEVLRRLGG
jgi:sugar phosphate isomerase/epimerase